jgi:protein involved in polysaccharide export with SLBB domain
MTDSRHYAGCCLALLLVLVGSFAPAAAQDQTSQGSGSSSRRAPESSSELGRETAAESSSERASQSSSAAESSLEPELVAGEGELLQVPEPSSEAPAGDSPGLAADPGRESRISNFYADIVKSFPQGLPFFGSAIILGESLGNRAQDTEDVIISPHYLLGPGDEIVVAVWGELSLNVNATVLPEGHIELPGQNRLYVNGLKFADLRETILHELRKSYASALTPEKLTAGAVFVQVTLSTLQGIQVFMTGQVAHPGVYQFPSSSVLLLNALAEAGGLGNKGSLRNMEIRRGGAVRHVDLYDLLLSGDIALDAYYLRHQDVVYLPDRLKTVSVEGSVKRPAIYELRAAETLAYRAN